MEIDYKKIFSSNLNRYMNIYGKNQQDLINDLHFNKSAVSTWCNGTRLPRMDKVEMLAKYFNCNRSDLIESSPEISNKNPRGVKINVLGRVAAGLPMEAIENIIDTEEIPEDMARRGEYYGLQIKGNSMTPRICEGDVVIVRKQEDAESDEIVIALVNGNDAVCKRLMKYAGGISLISFNPEYKPMVYTDEDIERLPVRIIGRVVELRAKF